MPAPISTAAGRVVPKFICQRRWWLLPLAVWAIACLAYFQVHIDQLRQQTTEVAIAGARDMFRMIVLTRNWNATHGGVYAPVTPRTQPNPYLKHPRRDVMTTDGVAMTMINPAFMTRLIAEMAESDTGAIFRLTSLKPVRPANAPDDWERKALHSFETGSKETWGVETSTKGSLLRYMAPLDVKEACLNCHEAQGYKIGDIRGGISVSRDYAPIASAIEDQRRDNGLAIVLACALISLGGWWLLETLRHRWLDLAGMINELEATQSQLLQSEKLAAIGQLAAGVAHEINNPIGFVSSNLSTLKRYSEQMVTLLDDCRSGQCSEAAFKTADFDYLKADVGDLLHESQQGLDRVRKIVADLKDFSRIDKAELMATDLNAGIESTLNVVWNELKYKAEVVRAYGELPLVTCIAAQINQVVMNLLVNAAQAIKERGTITIRTGHDPEFAWIEISDTGVGMPPAIVRRIFEPFFTTKPVGTGTGLGLSLSYDIVKKHGGHIDVQSAPGRGTCFKVVLPINAGARAPH